ncbi:hypothetical protein HYU19_01460 [Candidatus Woesearchaeota archaeon]|nr:hypothetical protein [Candidatus Woesearchaeota archaeon]
MIPICRASLSRSANLLIFLVLFLSLASLVSASAVILTAQTESNKVKVDEWASFYLTIVNNETIDDVFRISVEHEGVEWSMLTDPPAHGLSGIKIKQGGSVITKVFLKDIYLVRDEGRPYAVRVKVKSSYLQREADAVLDIYLLPVESYVKNISVVPSLPADLSPREQQPITIGLTNNNARYYHGLLVTLDSAPVQRAVLGVDFDTSQLEIAGTDKVKLISSTSSVELGPNETKSLEFALNLPPTLEPVQTTLFLTIVDGNDTLYSSSFPVKVAAYSMPFSTEVSLTESFFLKTTETYTIANRQNIREEQQVMIPAGNLKRFFSATTPPSVLSSVEGMYQHIFTIDLQPGASTPVVVVSNYRILLYAVLIAGLVVFLYFMFRSPISITKRAERISLQEGGVVDLKVVLTVKNKSHHQYGGVQVIEKVPALIKFDPQRSHTLVPSKVLKTQFGDVVYWTFDLSPQEERLIVYHIQSKLSILGDFQLPPSVLTFSMGEHKIHMKSNSLDVSSATKVE